MKKFYIFLSICFISLSIFIINKTYIRRYVWINNRKSMESISPLKKEELPSQILPFKEEKETILIATPKGLKTKKITFYVNSMNMDFVKIPQGTFLQQITYSSSFYLKFMRARKKNPIQEGNKGYHITISKPFYLAAFEVTNKEFEQFQPSHKNKRPRYQQGPAGDFHPVEPITWREAQYFAQWLSKKEGRIYRLPTATEWEYACIAKTKTRFYWGNIFWDRNKANLGGLHSNLETSKEDGYKYTAPVGMFPANPWGLYDMIGNSYEWVADWWHGPPRKNTIDPQGPSSGQCRMAMGGSWTTRPYSAYNNENDGNNPADVFDIRGFRLLAEFTENEQNKKLSSAVPNKKNLVKTKLKSH